jgi:TatD DNase family protein
MYADSHAHLTSQTLFPEAEEILKRAKKAGVEKIVNICTDAESLEKGLLLAEKHNWVFNTAATTPHDVKEEGHSFFPLVVQAAKQKKLVAIGETGLDYFYEHSDRGLQKEFLIRYFHLALEYRLPLVIHCRDAFADLFDLADAEFQGGRAVLHCFTGTGEEARQVLNRGWFVSISGIVTFKKSTALQEVARTIPLEQLLIETDSPYLAPQSQRGRQNEPAFIPETAAMIALLQKREAAEVALATAQNASDFFSFQNFLK